MGRAGRGGGCGKRVARRVAVLGGVVVIAHGLDVLTTVQMVGKRGFEEQNPVADAALRNFGNAGLVGLKVVVLGSIWYGLDEDLDERELELAAAAIPAIFAVVNNVAEVWGGPGLSAFWE